MKNIVKFYENTEGVKPHSNLVNFIEKNSISGKAIDLGCGAGRDTIYLIRKGWDVLAIDKNNTENLIASQLNEEELKRFKFRTQNFDENVKLDKNNLVVANFSLPFCNRNNFNKFWNEITQNISIDGYFVGNFFGLNDSWANIRQDMMFLSKKELLSLFSNFNIEEFKEIEEDGTTAVGSNKHWHIYEIVARKSALRA